jgi:hypothetical protein
MGLSYSSTPSAVFIIIHPRIVLNYGTGKQPFGQIETISSSLVAQNLSRKAF